MGKIKVAKFEETMMKQSVKRVLHRNFYEDKFLDALDRYSGRVERNSISDDLELDLPPVDKVRVWVSPALEKRNQIIKQLFG